MLALSGCVYGKERKKMEEQSMKLDLPATSKDVSCSRSVCQRRKRKEMEEYSQKFEGSSSERGCLLSLDLQRMPPGCDNLLGRKCPFLQALEAPILSSLLLNFSSLSSIQSLLVKSPQPQHIKEELFGVPRLSCGWTPPSG